MRIGILIISSLLSFIGFAQATLQVTILGVGNAVGSFTVAEQRVAISSDTLNLQNLPVGDTKYTLAIDNYAIAYGKMQLVTGPNSLVLTPLTEVQHLGQITINGKVQSPTLGNVRGTDIFAAKKTEVILPDYKSVNLANSSTRLLFKSIPGLNIWENDASGLQLNLGARGLNPNRTSNFNTRQNGYDISADALGYPESYYVPPAEAVAQINLVRGAAALQSGPHFGGLLDYRLKEREDKPLVITQSLSAGSFGFLKSFTSIGGQYKKWKYYSFFQKKVGNGFQPNARFNQNTAYLSGVYDISKSLSVSAQYTHMNYLAQQPGGLTDVEFAKNAFQSKRTRNWFAVNWNLYAFLLDKQFHNGMKLHARLFVLDAGRKSVGDLSRPNRPDPSSNRDLISGEFNNYGIEVRLLQNYTISGMSNTLLAGTRLYRGGNKNQQGFANANSKANFNFLNPMSVGTSSYEHPGANEAVFIENIFRLPYGFSIIPGLRYEVIQTTANGFYKNRLVSGGRLIFEDTVLVNRSEFRHFPLLGIGVSKKIKALELLGNITQNYRSINFSDITVVNPNLRIDPNLRDESGFNADLTLRGYLVPKAFWMDVSLFYLGYNNRIGIAETVVNSNGANQLVAYRTNIGKAYSGGLESYIRLSILDVLQVKNTDWGLDIFMNYSFINGEYTEGLSSFKGNKLEYVIPHVFKSGVTAEYNHFSVSYQYSYQSEQFTDANNSRQVSDATRGVVPEFGLHDLTLSYSKKKLSVKLTVSNLMDSTYFSRRALSYPGPGIIAGEPRSYYLSLTYKI
jgi:Fe(3+) dicitrate transport protein